MTKIENPYIGDNRKDKNMSKITLPSLMEMLKNGVHFGHQTSRWHPKMKPFIFTSRDGVHVIDLEQTQTQLNKAIDFIISETSKGGEVLFVGSKKQIKDIIKKGAIDSQSPYVAGKWVGGIFTNFKTVFKLIKKLEKLEKQKEKGEWDRYTKKEQLNLQKEYDSLLYKVGGIRKMSKLPSLIFVVDIKEEKTAINESRNMNIPIVAMCDTNVNPNKVNYPIPANDDAIRSVQLITDLIVQAVRLGKAEFAKKVPVVEKKTVSKPKEENNKK